MKRLFSFSWNRRSPKTTPRPRRTLGRFESLEARLQMAGGFANALITSVAIRDLSPIVWNDPVPAMSSNPGAARTLYLDFDGHTEASWASDGFSFANINMPRFDTDGSPRTLSATEMTYITDVWKHVAEDYAPFNVNVTTVDPGNWANANGVALRVVIGGRQSDMKVTATSGRTQADWNDNGNSGYASIGSFNNAQPNTVWVFSEMFEDWANDGGTDHSNRNEWVNFAALIGNTASHEAGHAFGLEHIAVISGGKVTNDYNPGTADWTPIMGDNYSSDRMTWTVGGIGVRPNGTTIMQDDMAVLTSVLGARADDHGNSRLNATNLGTLGNGVSIYGNSLSAKGIISTLTDVDAFSFYANAGKYNFNVAVASVGANLDSRLEIYRLTGNLSAPTQLVASNDMSSLGASLNLTLATGTYYAYVRSHGTAGDVGQYTFTANSIVPVYVDDSYFTQIHILPDWQYTTLVAPVVATATPAKTVSSATVVATAPKLATVVQPTIAPLVIATPATSIVKAATINTAALDTVFASTAAISPVAVKSSSVAKMSLRM